MIRDEEWATGPIVRTVESRNTHGRLWEPLEWTIAGPTDVSNPFAVKASATFTHVQSGEERRTGLFYIGDDRWSFRFTATQPDEWIFELTSEYDTLDGQTGTVDVAEATHESARGFVRHEDNRWAWSDGRVFVPQLVQYQSPTFYYEHPKSILEDVTTFIIEHGFAGFHSAPFLQWFDVERPRLSDYGPADEDPNPDPRTFSALETLISRTYRAGGLNYFWLWGAPNSQSAPTRWGMDSTPVRRLYRYIAARLGPLPGWIMGFGYDLPGWHHEGPDLRDGVLLEEWHERMAREFGWHHFLGARWLDVWPARPFPARGLGQFCDVLDYTSLSQHRVAYDQYVGALDFSPNKPVFETDRFRVREQDPFGPKDYTPSMVRRGLWHSTLAGGVGNVWGYLLTRDGESIDQNRGSLPFPNADEIATYHRFWFERDRFRADFEPTPNITSYEPGVEITDDGGVLATAMADPSCSTVIAYAERTDTIELDLTALSSSLPACAVNTCQSYEERDLGTLTPDHHQVSLPVDADWAIAIGTVEPPAAAE